jgi:hypothetical protein
VTTTVEPGAPLPAGWPTAAPSTATISSFIAKRAGFSNAGVDEDSPPSPSPREFLSGETFRYLGRQYRLKLERSSDADGRVRVTENGFDSCIARGTRRRSQKI